MKYIASWSGGKDSTGGIKKKRKRIKRGKLWKLI